MKKSLIFFIALTVIISSCKSVFSTTTILPQKGFLLGENEHEAYEVTVKNISKMDVEIFQKAIGGKEELIEILVSNKSVVINVAKNTAVFIYNKANNNAVVQINLKSNSPLSMGYKN